MGRNTDDIRSMAANSRRDPFKGKKEGKGVFLFGRTQTPVAPAKAKPAASDVAKAPAPADAGKPSA